MRRSPLVLLLVLPVAWVACFSSGSSGNGGGANFGDASEDVTFPDGPASGDDGTPGPDVVQEVGADAVAMSDAPAESMGSQQDGSSADAGPMDATSEAAAEAEAAPAAVVITVFGATGPEQGVTLVYGDATGAVVGTPATTGVTGTVSQPLPAGATMVTALLGSASSPAPYTVMGVQAGDTIVVPDFGSLALYRSGGVSVTAFPSPPPQGTVSYQASAGSCSGFNDAPPIGFALNQGDCIGLGMFGATYGAAVPVLAQAYDTNGAVIGFAFQKNNALTGFDAGTLSVSLAADSWSTATTTQDVVGNGPDGGALVNTAVSESADGVLRVLSPQFTTDDAGVQHTLVTTHVGYADTLQAEASIAGVSGGVATAVGMAPPAASGTVTIDATPLGTLPQFSGASVDGTTSPGRPTLTWALAQGALAGTTGLIATVPWTESDDAGNVTVNGAWTIVAPSSAGSVQAPAVPASASAYQPTVDATFQGSSIQALVGTVIPSYAQLRTAGAAIGARLNLGCVMNPVLPFISVGTLSVSVYSAAQCG